MLKRILLAPLALLLAGCSGPQSALDPVGRGAAQIHVLTLWMFWGALAIWLIVIGLALWVMYLKKERMAERKAAYFIIGGGAIVPSCVLCGLLVYGLSLMPELLEPAPPGALRIAVRGEQYWWRVQYHPATGAPVESANEVRLPVNEPVEFLLSSADVVHSFWIPALGPKMDMIPGRETRLTLHPTKVGNYRGVCAEFCGASHAFMALDVVVMERADFDRWLAAQSVVERPGMELVLRNGCGACHTIRGTPANGVIAPDLTRVGGRLTVAGILPNDPEGFQRWLSRPDLLKPGANMPHFRMLPEEELRALAAYLDSLE